MESNKQNKTMKYLFLTLGLASMLFLASFMSNNPSGNREITYKLVCDTSALSAGIKDCHQQFGVDTSSSRSYREYYTDECFKQQRAIHCKEKKGVSYYNGEIEVEWIPCDQVESKKDKKLCSE